MRKPTAAILALSFAACGDVCWDLQNEGKCNHDQCYVPDHASDETTDAGDTGDPPDDLACSALHRAKFSGQFMSCGGFVTDAEHCTQDAIHQWGLTDFDFHGSDSLVAKFDASYSDAMTRSLGYDDEALAELAHALGWADNISQIDSFVRVWIDEQPIGTLAEVLGDRANALPSHLAERTTVSLRRHHACRAGSPAVLDVNPLTRLLTT